MRSFDWNAEFFRENTGRAAMVDMTVGEEDFLDCDARLLGGRLEARQVAPGIDECAAHRLRAPDEAAVLLQWSDRNDRGFQRRLTHCAGASSTGDRAAGS